LRRVRLHGKGTMTYASLRTTPEWHAAQRTLARCLQPPELKLG
jgi:predicted CxxxxCH...CXXCH cytochrome family protein